MVFDFDFTLMMKKDQLKCKNESLLVAQEMNNLGLAINEAKSVLIPHTKVRMFWGVIIDTVLFKVFLAQSQVNKIFGLCAQIITTRKLSSFIGLCVHAFNTIALSPLHYRSPERYIDKDLAV
jgi:hypothetical protein